MTAQTSKALAEAILKAHSIREKSYNHNAAIQEQHEAIDHGYGMIDYSQFYEISIKDAAEKASKELSVPVCLLLTSNWNESVAWANGVLSKIKLDVTK